MRSTEDDADRPVDVAVVVGESRDSDQRGVGSDGGPAVRSDANFFNQTLLGAITLTDRRARR